MEQTIGQRLNWNPQPSSESEVNMPTYEYKCADCGANLEIVQSIHDPSLTDCPECGASALRKQFGNVGVVFKGSGFYKTDSRSSDKKSSTKPSGTSDKPKKTESTTSTSSESKSKPVDNSNSN
ncbi:MAG: FmdB family zinc ribbon protein [Candidatus Nanopelagicales bacterium]